MDDTLCFVQFLHPGAEHRPPSSGVMPWNTRDHRRKFLRAGGSATDLESSIETELVLWAEWEPQSCVVDTYSAPLHEGPRWLQDPGWRLLDPPRWTQNTDPFVFGDQFHFTGCQQHKKLRGLTRPTQLRNLAMGSVILFGSCRHDRFLLDTVFAIDRHIDHTKADHEAALNGEVSPTYQAVTIDPWYRGDVPDHVSHRLYFGATPERPVNDMFSFAPCVPRVDAPRGFSRPVIELPGIIRDNHRQSYRLNPQEGIESCARLWKTVAEQVLRAGLLLGTRFELPSHL